MDYRSAEAWGSSPHTRGAQPAGAVAVAELGIIPAYAGSTGWRRRRGRSGRDHPRIRGEHVPIALIATALAGSSPHTRGAPAGVNQVAGRQGIIPAYAGSTPGRESRPAARTDHPRIRGEHEYCDPPQTPSPGSSPHTRGAQVFPALPGVLSGIIPAYAGSTTCRRR